MFFFAVLSEEILQSFIENNLLGSITSLLEDFLIFKQVLVYKNGDLCYSMSTTSQFISSCILFALICSKTDQLDLIRGTAYKILLEGKSDISCALISTHILATICGERFFGNKEEKLLQNALCWVVYRIEKGCTNDLGLAPCQQCPFKMDAAGARGFVDSLLDELEACSLLKNQESHFVRGQHCSTSIRGRNGLCYFTEIVSLLELVGSHMVRFNFADSDLGKMEYIFFMRIYVILIRHGSVHTRRLFIVSGKYWSCVVVKS
jgi:hypothetical protein